MIKAHARLVSLIALALLLNACGAGTSPPPNPPDTPESAPGDLDETFGTKGMALYDDPVQGVVSGNSAYHDQYGDYAVLVIRIIGRL